MNIENVISFIYVYRLNSFQKAAEALYITQPSLSSRIKSLEKDFGTTLFERAKRGVALTESGKTFLPYALQMFDIYLQAQNCMRQHEEELTIGSIISASISILPNVIYLLQQKNPRLSIRVVTGKTSLTLERLLNKECQVAITEKIDHPEVCSLPIYQDPISLLAPPEHRFVQRQEPISINEIAAEPLVCFNPDSSYWQNTLAAFHKHSLAPRILFNIDSIEAAKAIIINSQALCFLPELSLEAEITRGQLCRVPIMPPLELYRELYLHYLRESPAPSMDYFINNVQLATQSL